MAASLLLRILCITDLLLGTIVLHNLITHAGAATPSFFLASAQRTGADVDVDTHLRFHQMSADEGQAVITTSPDETMPIQTCHPCLSARAGPAEDLLIGCDCAAPDSPENSVNITIRPVFASPISVLIFQTSFPIVLPCLQIPIIRPPRHSKPPVNVMVASPTRSGTYPVILFKHGFALANCFYTQLFGYLASSGYIVVAPQAVTMNTDTTKEIKETSEAASWISRSLAVVLHEAITNASVMPDVSKLVLAGHSRGGKIAFAMALGKTSAELPSFAALVALDPVDGTRPDAISKPQIVEAGCDHSLNQVPFPVLILGTGYGSQNGMLGMPACAPTCCNHAMYFNCSSSPIMYHFLASDYGHLDFLDDGQSWVSALCMSGSSKAPLRDFASELIVAFLESALEGKHEAMATMTENWETASITLEEPQIYRGEYMKREDNSM